MKSKRRRSARPDPARRRPASNLEVLESRQLLAQSPYLPISQYPIQETAAATNPGPVPPAQISHPIGTPASSLVNVDNQGKHISGLDRQGNRWTIDVKGPGYVVVTDTTPNDGSLDDDLATIRLVGTTLKTVVTGQTTPTARQPGDYTQLPTIGQVRFNSLIDQSPVGTVILNGFELTDTITQDLNFGLSPAESNLNASTGVQLHGGVNLLEFEGIDARDATTLNPSPIVVAIGNPTTPLTVKPTIRIDHIQNTVYDNTAFQVLGSQTIPTGPLTSPTVTLFVNGEIAAFHVVSITQETDVSRLTPGINSAFLTTPTQIIPTDEAALEYQFPTVGTTGRTAVQATAIKHIRVSGAATNVTFSKSAQPFQSSLTGLDSVGSAQFGGPTDAVAIDAKGNIKALKFAKGLGNPTGTSTAATTFGTPANQKGYAAAGLVGGQVVTEGNIGSLTIAPADTVKQYPQDPTVVKSGLNEYDNYQTVPGTATTSAIVVAGGSIGSTHVVGDLHNTEIKAGSNYYSTIGGAEGVSSAVSSIGPVTIRGNLVDSVISSSFRPTNGDYNAGVAGDGTIEGAFAGQIYQTSTGVTALGNKGSGFYSRYNNANPRPKTTKVVIPVATSTTVITAAKK